MPKSFPSKPATPAPALASAPAAKAEEKTAPLPQGIQLKKRTRRRGVATPVQGWALVAVATGRLGMWEKMRSFFAQRAFALAVQQLTPRLAAHARAEHLNGDTLMVRVSSSAVASELSYVKDLLLEQVNQQLGHSKDLPRAPFRRSGTTARPVTRLMHHIGKVEELPDARFWTAPSRPVRKKPPRPAQPVSPQVAMALGQVEDDTLRKLLVGMYAASVREKP